MLRKGQVGISRQVRRRRLWCTGLWILPALFFFFQGLAIAQEVSDCMECHGDPNKVGKVARIDHDTGEIKVVTMLVDEKAFWDSAHGKSKEKFTCIDCHGDLSGVYGEHDPLLKPVDCKIGRAHV